MPHPYTLTLFTPATGTPTYLHHLQKSSLSIPWIGQYAIFFRKHDPSTLAWNHIMLLEGHNVKMPSQCRAEQTLSYQIEADQKFLPDEATVEAARPGHNYRTWSDGVREAPDDFKTTCQHISSTASITRRFCICIFHTLNDQVSAAVYEPPLLAPSNLDMRIQLHGRITTTSSSLGPHAKHPAQATSKKNPSKWTTPFTWLTQSIRAAITAHDPQSKPQPQKDSKLMYFTLLSFPGPEEYGKYLVSDERRAYIEMMMMMMMGEEGKGREEMILTKNMVWDKPISAEEWMYGNPHEPFGQDWFG